MQCKSIILSNFMLQLVIAAGETRAPANYYIEHVLSKMQVVLI